ncbi:hypothetical protein HZH68_014296 [Vespula germanica]|uniref:Uncharacterized protein n=1 Tax=Vespula germanica TaxID=30212 RepID=A0A834JA82_VESGE|nr:hypothetical protein HZH68_014296 [Vespula germanica]
MGVFARRKRLQRKSKVGGLGVPKGVPFPTPPPPTIVVTSSLSSPFYPSASSYRVPSYYSSYVNEFRLIIWEVASTRQFPRLRDSLRLDGGVNIVNIAVGTTVHHFASRKTGIQSSSSRGHTGLGGRRTRAAEVLLFRYYCVTSVRGRVEGLRGERRLWESRRDG